MFFSKKKNDDLGKLSGLIKDITINYERRKQPSIILHGSPSIFNTNDGVVNLEPIRTFEQIKHNYYLDRVRIPVNINESVLHSVIMEMIGDFNDKMKDTKILSRTFVSPNGDYLRQLEEPGYVEIRMYIEYTKGE